VSEVTRILNSIGDDREAAEELLPIVYNELRRLAAHRLAAELPGQTLQPTALVHEAYVRLVGSEDPRWENRGHFFAAAAEAMRRILVDRARSKRRARHGGGRQRVELDKVTLAVDAPAEELLALDEALSKLEREDPEKARLVKLRFFAGLTSQQAAEALGVSKATADRHWAFARAWLFQEIVADEC
jgi:RNA polymerase sigma factor (TIGR02999 family)